MRGSIYAGAVMLLLTALIAGPIAGFTGSLSSQDGGLSGTGLWVNDNGQPSWYPAEISWTVTQNTDLTWHYSYTLTVFKGDVSHFIVETSFNFGSSDIINPQGPYQSYSVATFSPQDPSNPSMPASIYGIKFDSTTGTTLTISFDSPRVPVWGDFYAKNGNSGGTVNTMWNSGFTAVDPTDDPADGSLNNHLLVPDTRVVPEPASVAVLGCSLVGILLRRRKTA